MTHRWCVIAFWGGGFFCSEPLTHFFHHPDSGTLFVSGVCECVKRDRIELAPQVCLNFTRTPSPPVPPAQSNAYENHPHIICLKSSHIFITQACTSELTGSRAPLYRCWCAPQVENLCSREKPKPRRCFFKVRSEFWSWVIPDAPRRSWILKRDASQSVDFLLAQAVI